ncbi:type II secretion system F family protein [Streptomyces finlayi]|uniref:type II secretion system F family protein n=1 Tax=Streptomyces finlayi TaxID=67296 RepID=UPI001E457D45|nr:type II secretion system F family protein [Streptomyces finlayi]
MTGILVLCGCTAGAGLALLAREIWPAPPRLAPALRRLNPPLLRPGQSAVTSAAEIRWQAFAERVPGPFPRQDLDLLQQSAEWFFLQKIAFALCGLLLPLIVIGGWSLMGLDVPLFLPGVFGIVAAAALWFVPDWQVNDQAKKARTEFAHAAAAFLELVALRMRSNVGASTALEEAAAIGRGWPYLRLQEALARARAEKVSPWQAVEDLGTQLRLPVLADTADIMRRSSNDGAAVYATLRARAESMRTELLTDEAATANADSEKMSAPGALLATVVMFAIAFPGVLSIFTA